MVQDADRVDRLGTRAESGSKETGARPTSGGEREKEPSPRLAAWLKKLGRWCFSMLTWRKLAEEEVASVGKKDTRVLSYSCLT